MATIHRDMKFRADTNLRDFLTFFAYDPLVTDAF